MHRDELLRHAAKLLADPDAARSFAAGLDKTSRATLVEALARHVNVYDLRTLAGSLDPKRLEKLHQVAMDETRSRRNRRRSNPTRRRRRSRNGPYDPSMTLYDTEPMHVCCTHGLDRDGGCDCCLERCAFYLAPVPASPIVTPSIRSLMFTSALMAGASALLSHVPTPCGHLWSSIERTDHGTRCRVCGLETDAQLRPVAAGPPQP